MARVPHYRTQRRVSRKSKTRQSKIYGALRTALRRSEKHQGFPEKVRQRFLSYYRRNVRAHLRFRPLHRKDEKIYHFFIDFLGITIKIIKNPSSSDLDSSNSIDSKEALFLGVALSLDCFCIGMGGSMIGVSPLLFPLFISIFQLVFLNMGHILGKKLYQLSDLPDNTWSVISGILLVFIGLLRFVF